MQPGLGKAADYFRESNKEYWMAKSKVPAVLKPQREKVAAKPAPRTCQELIKILCISPRNSQMAEGTSRQGSCHMKLGSGKPQSHICIASLPPNVLPDSSLMKKDKVVEPVSFYLCMQPP